MSYRLKKHLSRPVEFWFVFETITGQQDRKRSIKREHLHGVVGAAAGERDLVSKALREVAKDYTPARAVKTAVLKDIFRPASYATMHQNIARLMLGSVPLTMPRSLNQKARVLYEAHVADFRLLPP